VAHGRHDAERSAKIGRRNLGDDFLEGVFLRAEAACQIATETRRVALRAWKLAGGFGYGRVDMRIDANGQPWILEVNANPDIAPDAGLARMARVAGIEYPALIRDICELALVKAREVPPSDEWKLAQKLSGVENAVPELDLFAVAQE